MSVTEAILWCLAALLAAGVWVVARTGDPEKAQREPARPPTRHEELLAARDRVQRQLEILESPGAYARRSDYRMQSIADLKTLLREIEEELRDGAKTP